MHLLPDIDSDRYKECLRERKREKESERKIKKSERQKIAERVSRKRV